MPIRDIFRSDLAVLSLAVCGIAAAPAATALPGQPRAMALAEEKPHDHANHTFLGHAARGGLMEVELGSHAANHAHHEKVKEFGARLVTDHSKVNEELAALAKSKNIELPKEMGDDLKKQVDDLEKLKGNEFDKAYIRLMVEDHKDDIKEFQEVADGAKDAEVKAFAAKTLPVLKEHLELAQKLDDLVNK